METAVSLRRLGACLLLGAGLAATACAQEVAALRLNFERSWIAATLGPVKRQMSELATLEKKLAAARDYDGAIRAREERLKLQHEIERLDKVLGLSAHCGLGHTACNPTLDTMKRFRPAYERRLKSLDFEPAFDLDEALAAARQVTGREDAAAHLEN